MSTFLQRYEIAYDILDVRCIEDSCYVSIVIHPAIDY